MSSDDTSALDVFISYSHRDGALREELETHLALLKREGAIRTWHDRRIGAGAVCSFLGGESQPEDTGILGERALQ